MTVTDRTLVAVLCSFLCALLLTKLIQVSAVQRNILDQPNERSSHSIPVPRIGGIAIVVATLMGCGISLQHVSWETTGIALGAIVLAVVGLIDDVRPLGAIQKYVPQVVVAFIASMLIGPSFIFSVPYTDLSLQGIPSILFATVWLTALTNSFNFMDGIDGMTAGVGIISAVALAILMGGTSVLLLLPLSASLAGFLAWNAHPATIFMGDVGSQFVGFVIGAFALIGKHSNIEAIPMIVVFSPFLFDTAFTIIRRLRAREYVFAAHRSHLYQRVTAMGFNHRIVTNGYYGAAAFFAVIAVIFKSATSPAQVGLVLVGSLCLVTYIVVVMRLERNSMPTQALNNSSPGNETNTV